MRLVRYIVLGLLLLSFVISATSWAQTQVLLVRHGETDWNKELRIQGQADNPLNEKGISQAQQFAEKVAQNHPQIAAIYSSDLIRAHTTAQATAEKLNMTVVSKKEFREILWGEIDGLKLDDPKVLAIRAEEKELSLLYPERTLRWDIVLAPGAESYNQLLDRVRSGLIELAKSHPNETILIFTHGRSIKHLIADLNDTDVLPELGNCGIAQISVDPENEAKPITFVQFEELDGSSHS